jgi:hypothetical protein
VYITLFDLLSNRFNLLTLLPRWKNIAPHNRALIVGLLIVIVLLLLCGTAVMTSYHYVPLIILGVFCGGVIAKVLGQFLAPKIQSHVTAFLGGITTGNIGSTGTGLSKLISGAADQINKLVTLLPRSVGNLSGAVTLALWITLLTALVVLAANAYYANQDSSAVGERVPAPGAAPVAIPSAAAAAAAAAAGPVRVPPSGP